MKQLAQEVKTMQGKRRPEKLLKLPEFKEL
jgi:hypothetical protein